VGSESRDAVKLCIGLVATMTALVLGLVTASAKSHFDSVSATVRHTAQDLLTLDRLLARYGPETAGIRGVLKSAVAVRTEAIWPQDGSRQAVLDAPAASTELEAIPDMIRRLAPADERQRDLKKRAEDLGEKLLQLRWLASGEVESSIPVVFIGTLVCWLTITFTVFGLVAPGNRTVRAVFLVSALSVGSAVFLILEMDTPFHGLMKVHVGPMRYALSHLNQ
ncbi:MAG TPA: DUF4239 domain-containing protein, partial [Thermoanaerobaculia bacterium]|nr:DUF4239 domain-containing protein [Thermoanaerobaculia bacterium]